jgi:hypothetical protein
LAHHHGVHTHAHVRIHAHHVWVHTHVVHAHIWIHLSANVGGCDQLRDYKIITFGREENDNEEHNGNSQGGLPRSAKPAEWLTLEPLLDAVIGIHQ